MSHVVGLAALRPGSHAEMWHISSHPGSYPQNERYPGCRRNANSFIMFVLPVKSKTAEMQVTLLIDNFKKDIIRIGKVVGLNLYKL